MKIGVSGASGQLGRAVLEELVQRGQGHQLVGISRSPETVRSGVDARPGDYDAPEALQSAYAGLDRLLLIPSADLRPGVRGKQMRAAIDAAIAAGVRHVHLVSAAGTRKAVLPELGESYWVAEQHLIQTAPSWTIIRMNYYAEAMAQEIQVSAAGGILTGLGDERVAYVSREDLAAALAGALVTEGHVGVIYNATGPEVVTGPQRAQLASEVLGKELIFAVIPEDQLRGGLAAAGLPAVVVDAVIDIKANFVRGDFDVVTTDVGRLAGRPPRSMRDILADSLT